MIYILITFFYEISIISCRSLELRSGLTFWYNFAAFVRNSILFNAYSSFFIKNKRTSIACVVGLSLPTFNNLSKYPFTFFVASSSSTKCNGPLSIKLFFKNVFVYISFPFYFFLIICFLFLFLIINWSLIHP